MSNFFNSISLWTVRSNPNLYSKLHAYVHYKFSNKNAYRVYTKSALQLLITRIAQSLHQNYFCAATLRALLMK